MAKEEVAEATEQTTHKYFEDQFDDEEVLFVFRKHPVVMRVGLVLGMFGPLVGVIPSLFFPQAGFGLFFGGLAAGCVLGGLVFLPSWISWYFSVYILTDQRFIQITQKRLFHRSVSDITLQQIQSVNYQVAGLQETMLGFGTIELQTYLGDMKIREVHHPAKIQKKIVGILRDQGVSTAAHPARQTIMNHEETSEDQETKATES